MSLIVVNSVIAIPVEETSVLKLPAFDPQLIEIFQRVTSQEQPPLTKSICKFSVSELESDPQATKTMMIFRILRGYECIKKAGATIADIFLEAVLKTHISIMAPLMRQVSAEELGKGFLYACRIGSLEIVRIILKDDRLSTVDLGKGYLVACRSGHTHLAIELKHNPHIRPEDLNEGYCVAYDAKEFILMESIETKASYKGIGKVFIQACKSGRNDIAEKLLQHPRLTFEDLQCGLSLAETNGLNLKNLLDSKTRTQLFLFNNRRFLGVGALVVAALALYTPVTIPHFESLKMVSNTESLFSNTQRCSSLKR